MTDIDWRIPPSMLRWLAEVPANQAVALLLRHSVRDHLPPGDAGYALPITEVGAGLAHDFGALLGRRLRSLHSSPLPRCLQTAESLRAGAGQDMAIISDQLLGDPGVYVIDGKRAWANWEQLGHQGVIEHLVSGDGALPGMADPDSAARFLVQHMLSTAADEPGIHVFVTHDSLVTATAARLLGLPLGREAWPWYLEGAFFWREGDCVSTAYRDSHSRKPSSALCGLHELDIIDLARRKAERIVGASCKYYDGILGLGGCA